MGWSRGLWVPIKAQRRTSSWHFLLNMLTNNTGAALLPKWISNVPQ